MNRHALSVLEFSHALDIVAGRASSALGAAHVRALAPVQDQAWIESEQARVVAMRALAGADAGAFRPEPIPDIRAALGRLRAPGSSWPGDQLRGAGTLLRSSRLTREALTDEKRKNVATAVLAPYAARLVVARDVESAIDRAIDADGGVLDEASPALRRIRRELRGAQGELVQLLERAMARLDDGQRVNDMSVTLRNGRYVIPIRREARSAIGGIVHDESSTGGTLFVEPPAAVEFGNRIRELESDELREIDRILRELTEQVRPLRDSLADALDALVELDSLYARARFAEELGCAPAAFAPARDGFSIRNGRHPLLLARGGAVVPFDLTMRANERTLLLSGPNTGGKTVLLKAIGLISALAQSGIPAPVGAESTIAIFDDCFADIGDEQSIEASLSTFSAHVRNLGEILTRATASSLVLVDELGSGTDPTEGAALGAAILEELTRRGTLTVATTHLGALKLLATELPAIVNASLQFDEAALAPTYRLIKGIPGRSYGLSIARRLQLPNDVLERAAERLPRGERDVAALLTDLEKREAELIEREAAAKLDAERAAAKLERVAERERKVRATERELEKEGRQDARRYLLDARAEVDRIIKSLRSRALTSSESGTELGGAADELEREARRQVETLAGEQGEALEQMAVAERKRTIASSAPPADAPIAVGDVVEVATLGGKAGRVVEMRGESAVVAVGAMKLTLPTATLRRTSRKALQPEIVVELRGDLPELDHAPSEVDLRGMRVDEMENALVHFVDTAVRADLKSVRIIHGKGTGALRERVQELLRAERRVRAFRMGAWNEGGAGVTVAELA